MHTISTHFPLFLRICLLPLRPPPQRKQKNNKKGEKHAIEGKKTKKNPFAVACCRHAVPWCTYACPVHFGRYLLTLASVLTPVFCCAMEAHGWMWSSLLCILWSFSPLYILDTNPSSDHTISKSFLSFRGLPFTPVKLPFYTHISELFMESYLSMYFLWRIGLLTGHTHEIPLTTTHNFCSALSADEVMCSRICCTS